MPLQPLRRRLLERSTAILRRRGDADSAPPEKAELKRQLDAVVELLLDPYYFSYRHARGVVGKDPPPPLDALAEALDEARRDGGLDGDLLARARGVLKQIQDGTLVDTTMRAQRDS